MSAKELHVYNISETEKPTLYSSGEVTVLHLFKILLYLPNAMGTPLLCVIYC
jgi:hypothetical protein